jgi:hypothetical protein
VTELPHSSPAPNAPRPVWPTVIGICSLCLASVALLRLIATMIESVVYSSSGMYAHDPWDVFRATVFELAAVGFLLLFSGWLLLKRRRSGRTLHMVYGWVGLLLLVCIGPIRANGLLSLVSYLPDLPYDTDPAILQEVLMSIFLLFWDFLTLLYGVFLLAWFYSGPIRRDVATWPDVSPAQDESEGTS